MRVFLLFLLLSTFVLAQQVCSGLATKTPVPVDTTAQSPNRAGLAAALGSTDLAAKKQAFDQKLAEMNSDAGWQAERAKQQGVLKAAAASSDVARQQQLAGQVAAAQASSAFQNPKAKFLSDLKCTAP